MALSWIVQTPIQNGQSWLGLGDGMTCVLSLNSAPPILGAPLTPPPLHSSLQPDMLEIGNGGLTDPQCRTHFGLWALMKAPLILGTDIAKLTPSKLAIVSNAAVIAVNQDSLGIQGRKLAVDGRVTPRFVGIAPCTQGPATGYNGVSSASLVWAVLAGQGLNGSSLLYNNQTGRCLAMGGYYKYTAAPLLFPCNASDPAQSWVLPSTTQRLGALLWYPATLNGTAAALTVGDSTLHTAPHGTDAPLPDAAYGLFNLTLTPYAPEAPCTSRSCDDYQPGAMWYFSRSTGRLHLGHFSANNYRCFGPNCYQLTGHLPTTSDYCLARVLSYDGNVGTGGGGGGGPAGGGGPLAGADTPSGDFVLALANHGPAPLNITAPFQWLETPGVDASTKLCGRELFTGAAIGVVQGSVTMTVQPDDIAMLRLSPDASC